MTLDQATEFLRHAMVLTLLVAAPVLAVGLLVSFVVSLIQAVTQVQEQTLTFIPKIIAMAVCVVLLLPWMSQHVIEFAKSAFGDGLL